MGDKQRVLIVDDTPANIKVLNELLQADYHISVATNGPDALELAASQDAPDLILLDIMMPEMDGYEVCRRLKAEVKTRSIPVLFVTTKGGIEDEKKGLEFGAVDYIIKPISPPIVKARVRNHMQLKRQQDNLEELVRERTRELELTQEVTIDGLAVLAEYRDPETGGHIQRTKHYVRALAMHLRDHPKYKGFLDDKTIDLFYKSASLHDIGKVGVTDSILLKPGRLTEEEFKEMERHVIYGHDAIQETERKLGDNSFLRFAREIAISCDPSCYHLTN